MNCMKKNIKTLIVMTFLFTGLALVAQDEQKFDKVIMDNPGEVEIFLLHEAASRNDVREVEKLLNAGVFVDTRNKLSQTPLHKAAAYGAVDVIKLLVSRGANINAISGGFGWTPLLEAVYWNYYDAVIELVKAGADVNIKAYMWGVTALHKAAYHRHNKIALFLINAGADVNVVDNFNASPLHYAARYSSNEVLESLVQHGANINQQELSKQTPLHEAVRFNNKETAKCLLSLGARTDILDKDGHNAEFYTKNESMKALFHPTVFWYNFFYNIW